MIDVSALRHGRRLEMVQKAQMSSGPAGGGGENTLYYVLIGATCLGGGVYVSTPLWFAYSSVPCWQCKIYIFFNQIIASSFTSIRIVTARVNYVDVNLYEHTQKKCLSNVQDILIYNIYIPLRCYGLSVKL